MRNQNKKVIIAIVLIGIVAISIVFAAFSSNMLIKSHLSVKPSATDFSVKFSSSNKSVVEGAVGAIPSSNSIVTESATINNSGQYPTISNLYAKLTEPGQSVSYTFYAHNVGKYDAYLTSIVLQPQAKGSFITCAGGVGTDPDLVEAACNSMSVTVKVSSDTASTIETSSTNLGISEHILPMSKFETITITLKYGENGERVDGPFEVNFGDIYLTYTTIETDEYPEIAGSEYACTFADLDKDGLEEGDVNGDGIADIGDMITCGTENFYVIPQDTKNHPVSDNTISMLAMYNLDVGTYLDTATSPDTKYTITEETTDTYGIQSEKARALLPDSKLRYGVITYSDTTYWLDSSGNLKEKYWYSDFEDYPAFVYDENSNIYPYIEAYETYLRKMGVNSAEATVLNPSIINAEYDWIENTTFWSGICYGNKTDRISAGRTNIDPDAASQYASYVHSYASGIGIRPVVIINKSELKPKNAGKVCVVTNDIAAPEGSTYVNTIGTIGPGDEVTCGNDYNTKQVFYVVPDHSDAYLDTVSLLSKYNITLPSDLTIEPPVQSASSTTTAFATSAYWGNVSNQTTVYNDNAANLVFPYVDAYEKYLENNVVFVSIRSNLPEINQLTTLGCTIDGNCNTSLSFINSPSYWLSQAYNSSDIYTMDNGYFSHYSFDEDMTFGIRPIIMIPETQIGI